jgi:DNA-binding NarL/FixJ family response regulator
LWVKIAEGLSEKELAPHFYRSIDAIKNWRKSLYSKLKTDNSDSFRQKNALDLYRKEEALFKKTKK